MDGLMQSEGPSDGNNFTILTELFVIFLSISMAKFRSISVTTCPFLSKLFSSSRPIIWHYRPIVSDYNRADK